MKKIFFIIAATMLPLMLAATINDDSKKPKLPFIEKVSNKVIPHLKKYKPCFRPTIAIPVYNGDTRHTMHTPFVGLVLASHISLGLFIKSPPLKLAFLAALLIPYATEVCIKATAQNALNAHSNDDSPYIISDITRQNALLLAYGD